MSEVDARPPPPRGRSSYRGGRGGFGRGGPRGGRKPVNGTTNDPTQIEESLEDQGELGEMKKKYASELVMLKDMFPDWTDVDLVFALQEADGDVPSTVDHITQGNVSQFAEVKSTKDRARSKVKEPSTAAGGTDKPAVRGGRGRGGFDGTRGGRGRASDRGRGGARGGRGGHASTNGTSKDIAATSVPTTESTAWDDSSNIAPVESSWDTPAQDASKDVGDTGHSTWGNVVTSETTPAAASEGAKSSLIPEGGPKKSWASMFAPKPAPAPAKKAPALQPPPAELVASGEVQPGPEQLQEEMKEVEAKPPPPIIQEPPVETSARAPEGSSPLDNATSPIDGEELAITPSKDPLTEANVEHLPDDTTNPPATQTAASTAGSMDPRNLTPLLGQQAPIARPPMGGYATSAYRATGVPGRSASYQRRVQEQQEAVVMPGHNAVDRAAVQFGSMGLNGEPGLDVDEDREEPETRQAPQHSPPSQVRTSLPPAPRQTTVPQELEGLPTPKQAPGLPPASQQNQQQMQQATLPPGLPTEPSQMNANYGQYARYAQPGMQQEPGMPQQKQYDPFSHQAQPTQYDQYSTHTQQAPQQQQPQQSQSSFGGLSSTPNDYSHYYTSDQQQRGAYRDYYGNSYGPQDVRSHMGQGQQDAGLGQQRSTSGFATGPNESAFSSQVQQQVSIPPSLLELNAALNNCSNESERQFLLAEIQRVVSNAQTQVVPKTQSPYAMVAQLRNGAGLERVQDSPSQGYLPTSLPPLTDAQSRFADATGSGHNTPNPLMGGQQQQAAPSAQQSQPSMHQASGHQQQGGYGGGGQQPNFPYGHPYYASAYPNAYQNQFGYNQQLSGYGGGGYPSKQHGGMYGGSHGYSMGPQSSYDQHSASPANVGAFGQNQQASMRSASGMSAGLGNLEEYGRSSAQPAAHQQSGGFGGMNDTFTRSTSGFGGQSGYGQQSMAGPEETLKPYTETKGGPSPALGQPGGRPGSAANSAGGTAQTGLPPPQSHQSGGFGGYPGFPGQSGYGGLGGLGSQQQQHGQSTMGGQSGYGSYGAGGGYSQTYGGYNSRGGWGSNYTAH